MKCLFTFFLSFLCLSTSLWATTEKYRCVLRDDPSTTMTIGWDQVNGSNAMVYYDVVDHGTNTASYAFSHGVDRTVSAKGMDNTFSRLTGLQPNTIYYFVIEDNNSTSARFSFRTAPNVPTERLSFIAGGDSRNNRTPRQNANRIVAKTRSNGVLFGGDMTNLDTSFEWDDWMDDWQLTIATDGRMTPIIAARGNHEYSNTVIYDLFDTPTSDAYYALTFGGNLFRAYTLNTLISVSGSQKAWLENDLQANQNVCWKSAQYHHPMRPHVSNKSERNDLVTHWAPLFENYGVNFVVECDAHTVKTTYPIRTSNAPGNDEGFVRDDVNGVVYMGEGCWGAPLRANDDSKSWSRHNGSFNQVKWIFINQDTIEARTIKVDNAPSVSALTDTNRFTIPANMDIWEPAPGEDVVYIVKREGVPEVTLHNPLNGQVYMAVQAMDLEATAIDTNGMVVSVDFYVNGTLVGTDSTAPYTVNWQPSSAGFYLVQAVVTDDDGYISNSNIASVTFYGSTTIATATISQSSDDAEERTNGDLSLTSSDLEMVDDGGWGYNDQVIGLRFSTVNIPAGATIINAYIQFTCDETSSTTTNLSIEVEDLINAPTFVDNTNNITNRTLFTTAIPWSNIPAWNNTGAATADEQTPNLSILVQHLVNKSGWAQGNPMVFVIKGTGERIAEAFDGSDPAQLIVEYQNSGTQMGTIDMQIETSSDDAEEEANGTMDLNSSDLELVYDGSDQTVGVRFNNINLPQGATITSSYIQFACDELSLGSTNLLIEMEDNVNPPTFSNTNNNISSRLTLANNVAWSSIPLWGLIGAAGTEQRTPDLTAMIQSMVNNNNWTMGNAMAFIITGTGERTAEAFDGDANLAPRLIINYTFTAPPVIKPTVADASFCFGASTTLDGGMGYAQYFWNQDLTLNQGQFLTVNAPGPYILRAMDALGQVSSDTAQVTVNPAPSPDLGADQNLNGGAVTFTPTQTYSSYLWSTGATTNSITTTMGGVYTLTVTDANGCTATDVVEAIDNVLSVKEINKQDLLQLYPNPAKDDVQLDLALTADQLPVEITLWNAVGQPIKQLTTNVIKPRISLNNVANGHYTVQVITADEQRIIKPLVVRK